MPLDFDKLRRELRRLRLPPTATITPMPGGEPVEVGVGDTVEISYEGEVRRVLVLAILAWGLRCWDIDKSCMRSFRFSKIGVAGDQTPTAQETDKAASG